MDVMTTAAESLSETLRLMLQEAAAPVPSITVEQVDDVRQPTCVPAHVPCTRTVVDRFASFFCFFVWPCSFFALLQFFKQCVSAMSTSFMRCQEAFTTLTEDVDADELARAEMIEALEQEQEFMTSMVDALGWVVRRAALVRRWVDVWLQPLTD